MQHDEISFQPDYDELLLTPPPVKRSRHECPVLACTYSGSGDDLADHWRGRHDPHTVLRMCPVLRCGVKVREAAHLVAHFERSHHYTPQQCAALSALPPLAEKKVNKFYLPPGDVLPPTAAVQLPAGARAYSYRVPIGEQVKAILQAPAPPASREDERLVEIEVYQTSAYAAAARRTPPAVPSGTRPAAAATVTSPQLPVTPIRPSGLDDEIQAVEGELARLQDRRRQLQVEALAAQRSQLQVAEHQLKEAQHRVQALERQIQHTASQTPLTASTVGSLEALQITRGLVLFPCVHKGQETYTMVYGLSAQDLSYLQLGGRTPLLSCAHL